MIQVYVRAETADGRWASVPAEKLDEDSFRRFVLDKMAEAGLVFGLEAEYEKLTTPLTKAEVDDE